MNAKLIPVGVMAMLAVAPVAALQETGDLGNRPDWSMKLADGSTVSAKDFDGKVVIVDFWATWCPPCRQEIPGFIQLQKQYGEKGFVMLGMSFDQDPDTHAAWIKEQGLNYRSILVRNAQGAKVVEAFEKQIGSIEGIPTTLVLDRKGKIVYKHVGFGSKESFEKVIVPLLDKKD